MSTHLSLCVLLALIYMPSFSPIIHNVVVKPMALAAAQRCGGTLFDPAAVAPPRRSSIGAFSLALAGTKPSSVKGPSTAFYE